MRQGGTAGSVRLWAARLLMVCALAVCAGAVRAPMHSPGPMPSIPSLAMTQPGYGAGAEPASVSAAVFATRGGDRTAAADTLQASAEAPGQDSNCGCCPHDAAACCVATSEDLSPHVWVCPRDFGGHEPSTGVPAVVHARGSRAASPSLSELSLLRI